MKIPLTAFHGFVKQVDRHHVGTAGEIVLDNAFPRFWPADPSSEAFQTQNRVFMEMGVDYIANDVDPPRRFSSCWSLPRGRYYSLCYGDGGDDASTLVHELAAYLEPNRAGLVVFTDMALPGVAAAVGEQWKIQLPPGPYILLFAIGRPGAISPLIEALGRAGVSREKAEQQKKERVVVGVTFPYRVEHCVIERTFDLRTIECQEYLVEEFFNRDTPQLNKADRHGVKRFWDCLPLLMNPQLGGGHMTDSLGGALQALAAFLRDQGAQALIYPSARCDVLATSRAGNLTSWRGWCLVDYRGAPEPWTDVINDLSAGWPKLFPRGATIQIETQGEFAGSFEVQGLVDWHRQRITELEERFVQSQGDSKV